MDGLGDLFGGGFEDLLGGLGKSRAQRTEDVLKKASEKIAADRKREGKANAPMPQVRGKTIDGVKYLRAEDVLAALEKVESQRDSPLARKIRDYIRR